ncbi:MAG: leucine-rich repeat domain-containing protein [Bacteroidaceae bacterium]|nr:leucine-rich repeat domain-containing protein [Bacteroidaceae bacterium]
MKKKLFNCFGRMTAVVMALMLLPLSARADVEINEANFPDENFRAWLSEQNYGQDGVLTDDEIQGIKSIDVDEREIKSLEGIGVFTALTYLSCNNNQLTSLDVSGCAALQTLGCSGNKLTKLDVSGCTALEALFCFDNKLTKLDVSGCTALTYLSCDNNQLTKLNVSGCTALQTLYCYNNQLTSLDVLANTALQTLYCDDNQLTSLDVSGCTALQELYCYSNQLTKLDVSGCTALQDLYCHHNQLTSLDVLANTALQELYCYGNKLTTLDVLANTALQKLNCNGNQLTKLDVSGCTALQELYCYNNKLTKLDVSGCTALQILSCFNNQLTKLDVSGCTALTYLMCYDNQLTTLDVSGCTALQNLRCYNNQLTSLDVSGCTALQTLLCYSNQISGEAMNALIAGLSDRTDESDAGQLIVFYEAFEGNVCTKTNVADARAKGWTVYYYNRYRDMLEYEGVEIEVVDNERYMLHKVEIEGVEYSLYKQVVNGNDVRRDPDGKESYRSKLSLDVKRDDQTTTYDIDDELYFSAGLDYRSDIQPMQFDMDKREIFIFTQSATATNNRDYTYDGFAYVTSMDEISFNKERVFKNINQGFFSRFIDIRNERVAVTHFRYQDYRPITSIRSKKGQWTTVQGDIVATADKGYQEVWNRMGENILMKGKGYAELDDELYQAAMDAIKPGTRYYIYTIYDTSEGPVKYYLNKEGMLVEWSQVRATDRFSFTKVSGSSFYATPGLKMNINFSNPKPDNGTATGNIVPQGHILVETNYQRNDWEGKVLFKKGDCFAVRATNSASIMWGADTYWCTLDSNGDGVPEADYGLTPSFVWYLENPNADSIDDIENEADQADAPIYDLSGRRLQGQPVQKGIYLRNGKKILYK